MSDLSQVRDEDLIAYSEGRLQDISDDGLLAIGDAESPQMSQARTSGRYDQIVPETTRWDVPRDIAALAARGVYRGIAGAADIVPGTLNLAQTVEEELRNKVADWRGKPRPEPLMRLPMGFTEATNKFIEGVGIPESTTSIGRVLESVISGAVGGKPIGMAKAGAAGMGASSIAGELGGGPLTQIAAGLVAGAPGAKRAILSKKVLSADEIGKLSHETYSLAEHEGSKFQTREAGSKIQTAIDKSYPREKPGGGYTSEDVTLAKDLADLGNYNQPLGINDLMFLEQSINAKLRKYVDNRGEMGPQGKKLLELKYEIKDTIDKIPNDPSRPYANEAKALYRDKSIMDDIENMIELTHDTQNPATNLQTMLRHYLNKRGNTLSSEERALLQKAVKITVSDEVAGVLGSRLNTLALGVSHGFSTAAAQHVLGMAARGRREYEVLDRLAKFQRKISERAIKNREARIPEPEMAPQLTNQRRPRSQTAQERYAEEQRIAEGAMGPKVYGQPPASQKQLPHPEKMTPLEMVGQDKKPPRAQTAKENILAREARQRAEELGLTPDVRRVLYRNKIRQELGESWDKIEKSGQEDILDQVEQAWLKQQLPIDKMISGAKSRLNILSQEAGMPVNETAMMRALLNAKKGKKK